MSGKGFGQVLNSLGLTSSSWSLWSTSIVEENGSTECDVTSVSELSDDKSRTVTEVLVIVAHDRVGDLNEHIIVLPIVSELLQPSKVIR
jgi:hypothetical protein